jgi:SAM-dependent methyltransferase
MNLSAGDLAWRVKRRLWAPIAALPIGGKRRCVICEHRVARFLPFEGGWRAAPPLMRALEVIGSDLDHFECPRCGAIDRERHLFLYMSRTGLLADLAGKAVIHFAPETHLSRKIARQGPARYVRCDLYPSSPGVERQDMLAMTYPPGSADVVIANHVLEHVADVGKALGEVRRVLKAGGLAILQTPFSPVLETTWEDAGIATDAARLQAYGQADHVRLFGCDMIDRIAACGFIPRVRAHDDLLSDIDADEAGVNPREPFLLFERGEG